ncbi:hypothetical protein KAFR_0I01850 [Kazachstania africana CBS 2517]|uniref:Polyprenal reductase n=1 Tax=Kazachstania africana (strain ATCC 22294 / BCRC 22015 / CBS 2517 / CECT 1963 / NBRC 1671 / NRRL Y-8276) TaxID=1071382 RepID=H2B015_KAZAF|nr:hypothetical protein KAFR_0I01850 [Kazachstania africana CBS 2517]CCF59965.1 hypothetical protein KAFR_0I01850 [Kazachstania africana CBS 2517]
MLSDQSLNYLIYSYRFTVIVGLLSLVVAKYFLTTLLQYGKTFKRHESKNLIEKIVFFTVPKSYFSHFYMISTVLSIVTLTCYRHFPIVWLILTHSMRRLYETLFVFKETDKSRMHWSHYIVGLWFYTTIQLVLNIQLGKNNISTDFNKISFILFTLASWDQNKNHMILSRLVKYSLPKGRLFNYVCCPHYLDEIIIYFSLTLYNIEFSWLLIWVLANLSVSSIETRKYYIQKFSDERVPKYSIIPCIL